MQYKVNELKNIKDLFGNMSKIKLPTAKEYWRKEIHGGITDDTEIANAMIGFAKLHVKAALLKAAEKAKVAKPLHIGGDYEVDEDSILNVYSENTVK